MTATELLWKHRALAERVRAHNCAVIVRRRRGCDWAAPENQYRNAISEAREIENDQNRTAPSVRP